MEKNSQEWEKIKEEFKEWYFDTSKIFSLTKDMYISLITSLLFDRDDISNPQIEGRVKDRKSCIEKFERKYLKDFEHTVSILNIKEKITDFIGIRIICSYEDEMQIIENIIKQHFDVIEKTDKTQKLKKENTFGYKGVHLDVKLSQERLKLSEYKKISEFPVEIQIRTIIQHAWSYLDHKLVYKKENSAEVTRSVERLAALFEIADSEFMRLKDATRKQEMLSEEKIKAIESKTNGENYNDDKEKINFITFNKFLTMKFTNYNFYEYRTNLMLQEIFRCNQDFSLNELTESYETHIEKVKEYKKNSEKILSMNPYTMLRHMLYSYHKSEYAALLTDAQRKNYDDFLNQK